MFDHKLTEGQPGDHLAAAVRGHQAIVAAIRDHAAKRQAELDDAGDQGDDADVQRS